MAEHRLSHDVLQIVAERLLAHEGIKEIIHDSLFSVAQPGMFTVKGRFKGGEYRKLPFLGGEEMRLSTLYAGKSGQIVFVFKPKKPSSEYQFIEITQSQMDSLNSFEMAISTHLGMTLSRFIVENGFPLSTEEKKFEKERLQADYGERWGLFG